MNAKIDKSAVAKRGEGIESLLEDPRFREKVAVTLRNIMSPDVFVGVTLNAIRRNPALMTCDKASFFNALKRCAELGLRPDGRHAALIPFNNNKANRVDCQLIVMWAGLRALVDRTGKVKRFHGDVIREKDDFEHNLGRVFTHTYKLGQDRGEVIGAYVVADLVNGEQKACVMSIEEIDAIRRRSRAKDSGPWVTDTDAMRIKTAGRRLCNSMEWGEDFPLPDDDDSAEVTVTAPQLDGKALGLPEAPAIDVDDVPMDYPKADSASEVATESEPSGITLQTQIKGRDTLAVIRKAIAKEGIKEEDFAKWVCDGNSLDDVTKPDELLANLGAEIDSFLKALRGE